MMVPDLVFAQVRDYFLCPQSIVHCGWCLACEGQTGENLENWFSQAPYGVRNNLQDRSPRRVILNIGLWNRRRQVAASRWHYPSTGRSDSPAPSPDALIGADQPPVPVVPANRGTFPALPSRRCLPACALRFRVVHGVQLIHHSNKGGRPDIAAASRRTDQAATLVQRTRSGYRRGR